MEKNLEKFKEEYNNLQRRLSQLSELSLAINNKKSENKTISLNKKNYGELSKQFSFLQSIIDQINKKEKIEKSIKENEELLKAEKDKEFQKLAEEEISKLKQEKEKIEKEIERIIEENESDKSSTDAVIVEIRAGVGGEEASLFAKELFEMYQKFCQKKDWHIKILSSHSTDLGGIKEISFEIKGKGCEDLKYESGVHRVQRIPETEKLGRVHTSTVSVAVLEKPKEKEIEIRPQDLRIDTYRASGPGGQYVNRRDSAVRITHIPTGIQVASQSARTQIANRENAMSLLEAKLFQIKKEEEEKKLEASRKGQIGKAMRAEKIRTYNFPQDRITDHRIKKSWKHINEILEGNLDELIEEVKKHNI
ncbi:MAG TPA: peptide chain release factor 1 [Candidatus Pacearchaeota archaeon]|nr:peptide chain release factor 1 [Candidatus Pacearchaeota archaeon]HPZ74379.1 peptide chain release factor 1 [Candidatus Pacearchaeota archaeon]